MIYRQTERKKNNSSNKSIYFVKSSQDKIKINKESSSYHNSLLMIK